MEINIALKKAIEILTDSKSKKHPQFSEKSSDFLLVTPSSS